MDAFKKARTTDLFIGEVQSWEVRDNTLAGQKPEIGKRVDPADSHCHDLLW